MIKVKGLYKIYKTGTVEVQALKDINFEVKKGEFVSIMGTSGSGKSTLMNILGCLDKATKGNYILDGQNIAGLQDNKLAAIRNKKIGFVFQSYNLLSKTTALKNVELPMMYAGSSRNKRRKKAIELLDKVGLSDRIHHKPNELSGGQKQRVAIARALINNPSIILADEPTGNLDTKSGEEIMQIFQRLNDEGVTIVLVTHEPEIAEHTKRVVVFRDGRLIEDKIVENQIIL